MYCFCTKFGQLILRKIIKTVATRCQILRLKCTKIQNSAGAPPQTPLGSLQRSPHPTAGFKEPTSKGRGGYGRGGEGKEGKERGEEGRGRERRGVECCGVQKILKVDPGLYAILFDQLIHDALLEWSSRNQELLQL